MAKLNNAFRFSNNMLIIDGTAGIFMSRNEKFINNSPTSGIIEP